MSKETSAWMPLYVSDYLKGTMHLSTMEHGAYLLLIMHAWTHDGALPVDEARLARIAGMTPKEWKASRDVILEFFEVREDGIRHDRIDKEIGKAEAVVEQRRSAGRASAAARRAQRESNDRSTSVATKVQRNGRPSQLTVSEANASPRESDAGLVDFTNDLCRDVGLALPDFGTAERNRQTVEAWVQAGADRPLIRAAVTNRNEKLREKPRSLAFFDRPVREAIAAKASGALDPQTANALRMAEQINSRGRSQSTSAERNMQ